MRAAPPHGDRVRALAAPPLAPGASLSRWRHKGRGTTYQIIGVAQVQATNDDLQEGDEAIIYRSEQDGSLWVRPRDEFEDGRFERLDMPPAPETQQEAFDLVALENSIAERSKRFRTFDDRREHSRYMALALAGEVGELCNLVKKEWRGDPKGLDGKALLDEASDIFRLLDAVLPYPRLDNSACHGTR